MKHLLTRRRLALLAVAAGAVLLPAVALAFLLTGGRTDTGDPGERRVEGPLIGPIDDGFVRRDLAPGEAPPEEHGVVFFDARAGAAELWTFAGANAGAFVHYDVDPAHRWLLARASHPDGADVILGDRATGLSYRFAAGDDGWLPLYGGSPTARPLWPTPDGILVAVHRTGPSRLAVVDLVNDPTGLAHQINLGVDSRALLPLLLESGRHAVIANQLVDLLSGDTAPVNSLPDRKLVATTPDGGWLEVAVGGARGAPAELATIEVRWFDANGLGTRQLNFPAGFQPAIGFGQQPSPEGIRVSPDGRWLAWQGSLPLESPPFTRSGPSYTSPAWTAARSCCAWSGRRCVSRATAGSG